MCGIAGIVASGDSKSHEQMVRRMTEGLIHRGPDAEGYYSQPEQGVFLGHRRLSIIDPAPRANQPMTSVDGKHTVVFNGEVYNYVELRKELEAHGRQFRTSCDTEVILQAYGMWGTDCFARFRGMFAVAVYDREERRLVLCRDPLGIKPLYYVQHGDVFTFASEAHVLWESGPLRKDVVLDEEKVEMLLAFSYVPDSENTIVRGVHKVPAGTIMEWKDGALSSSRYWSLSVDPSWQELSFEDGCARFETLLRDTIRIMLRSDVPLSFLLSGGVDSSLVVSMASELCDAPLQTYTAVFEHELDERSFARTVADHCGTHHVEVPVVVHDVLDELVRAIPLFDDLNTTDAGLFTTSLISREVARRGTKVAFVGEGSDEILGGYSWFGLSQLPFRWLPLGVRAAAQFYAATRLFRPRYWPFVGTVSEQFRSAGEKDICRQITAAEVNMQLPNHYLEKVDRATMSASIEARVPFMDHEIVRAAYSMPAHWKRRGEWFHFSGVQEKYISRVLAAKRLPQEIAWRKKQGFFLPIANTIIENKDFVRSVLLSSDSLARRYYSERELERIVEFRNTMYHPVEKEKEVLCWRLLLLALWHRQAF